MKTYKNIQLRVADSIAILELSRPDRLNVFDREMDEEFSHALDLVSKERHVRVLIITGAGRAFCSGRDIASLEEEDETRLMRLRRPRLLSLEKPVIAAVNGYAFGEGADIALMCDIILASEEAKFAFPGARLGIVCPYALVRLSEEIGRNRAKELLMTGRTFDAEEAFSIGLVNRVVPKERLMEEALSLAKEIVLSAPLSVTAIKKAVNRDLTGFELSYETMRELMKTEDFKEGVRAFLEKRKPDFKGR
jgi:enoyl-CoA hydratase/carnithine racemase